jgi:histidine triad (HIT) family protein
MSENDCVFCRIAAGELPATLVHEDERALAFEDLNPQAPEHLLVIPRDHTTSVASLEEGDRDLAGHLLLVAGRVARERGLESAGYRVVANVGDEGGQTVGHLHLHVLGGRPMRWPPG